MSFVAEPLWNQFIPVVLKYAVGLTITGLLGVAMWPVRKIRQEWKGVKESLAAVHEELGIQRSNCLETLQRQGDQQIDLLGKTVAALDGVRLDLATQTGYMAAQANKEVPRRRSKK